MVDTMADYLVEIGRYPLLSKSQEIILARQVAVWVANDGLTSKQEKMGRKAYEKLINCNLRLVVSIAKKFRSRVSKAEMLDLIQEGNIGLSHGIKKFDPERGYALSTYVYWWIRQGITRYLSCSDRVIRLPSHAGETLAKLRKWTPNFFLIHGRAPTLQESADFCEITEEKMRLYLDNAYDAGSLDKPMGNTDGETTLLSLITANEDLLEKVENTIRLEAMDSLLERLKPDEKDLVMKYYGMCGQPPATLLTLAKEVGLSRERVRQKISNSLKRLKVLARQHPLL
jgi:RNA polymerase nonessential primary-like sigma factor